MNPEVNGHGKFQVVLSTAVGAEIKEFFRRVTDADKEDGFLRALKEIERRLESDPGNFGEPLFYLKSLNLEMRVGIVLPFAVTFGINYPARTIFVSRITTAA